MGIQINGQTDTITAVDGGLTIQGADLPTASVTNLNVSGVTTTATLRATSIVGVTTAGISTVYVTSINEGQLQGYRNMLYNGAMVVNQRGYTSAASTSTGYSVDRWVYDSSSDAVVAIGQSTSVAAQPTGQGFTNSLHVRVTTADSSLSTGQYSSIQQRLEGYDLQRIKKGSANAEPVTLSFWVRSSKTGTYICELFDDDNSRQVSKSYTINAADTWEKKIITFPTDTTGAFNNDNNLSLYLFWWLAAGSTYSGGTLNTSWAGFTQANRAVGQVNFLDTAGAQFNLTGCQLEVGPNATDFEFRSYGDELRMCQRYYWTGTVIGRAVASASVYDGTFNMFLPVPMRISPSIPTLTSMSNTANNISGNGSVAGTTCGQITNIYPTYFAVLCQNLGTNPSIGVINVTGTGTASAEL